MSLLGDVFDLYPETVNMSAGATLVVGPIPGQNSVTLKYVSGGSMVITSLKGNTLAIGSTGFGVVGTGVAVASHQYIMGTSEILNFDGRGNIYITATGATLVFSILRGRSIAVGE